MSESIKSVKRKSDTFASSKGDFEDIQPSKKRSKSELFSESNTAETQKPKILKIKKDKQLSVRLTRRSRNADVNDPTDKKTSHTNVKNKKELKATKAIQKQATSAPTRSKSKVEQTKTIAQKKIEQNQSTKTSRKLSDTQPQSRSSRRTRTSSQNVEDVSISQRISSRKTTPNKSSVVTPQPTTTNEKPTRQRLISSAPPTQKVNCKTAAKNTASSKPRTSPKSRSSLSNLDPSNLDRPTHRTRRALAKEFMVNNVITRNRSSIDGVKLLQKVPTPRRKSIVGIDSTEKRLSSGKSKKKAEDASPLASRPRRLRSLEKK